MYELLTQGRWRLFEYIDWLLAQLWKPIVATLKELAHAFHWCHDAKHACEEAIERWAPWSVGAIIGIIAVIFIHHLRSKH